MTLEAFFRAHRRVAVAFSGGADSAFLLWAAKKQGCEVRAYYGDTCFQPAFAKENAIDLAAQMGVPLEIVPLDVLSLEKVAENSENRCYFCKKALFSALWQSAQADGFEILLDGNNASDSASDRPGMRALEELGVLSPLRLCGLTKAEIRRQSKAAGLPTWNLPAYACLATRIPTGTKIMAKALLNIDRGEAMLREAGFSDFRLRLRPWGGLLQLPKAQFPLWKEKGPTLSAALSPLFPKIVLDETPRNQEAMPL